MSMTKVGAVSVALIISAVRRQCGPLNGTQAQREPNLPEPHARVGERK